MNQILLVEDDDDLRTILSEILQEEGYAVIEAMNGRHALEKIYEARPDLVLLDLFMPIMNGIQFRTELRSNKALYDIPTVILSADVQAGVHCQDLDIAAHVKKPMDMEVLLETVKRFCSA